ncbi:YcjF family protein [Endozoicomonas ascidiicola]|nr:GTPase [Endozoicomonas ascidiicola]
MQLTTLEYATKDQGHVNILIAGRSGVGKSTLINSVFQSDFAETGQGKPVTRNTVEIVKEGFPLSIFDTRGLEMTEFSDTLGDLERIVSHRCSDKDERRHIHLAWICIQEDGRRIEDAEINLHDMLSKYMPVITVITKARSDNGFKATVESLMTKSRRFARVRALEESLDDGYQLPPMGLEALISLSSEVIPEGKHRALAAAQKANLHYKKSVKIVLAAAKATVAAVGKKPIPLSDAGVLAPIQIGMIAGIRSIFGMKLAKTDISSLVSSAIQGETPIFREKDILTNVLKLIHREGTASGGIISAATASAITVALGEAYISVLSTFQTSQPDTVPDSYYISSKLRESLEG